MSDTTSDRKQGRGRPIKYASDEERRAARAAAARKRRAALKEQGLKEVRRLVPTKKDRRPKSAIIDLSAVSYSKRNRGI